MVEELEDTSDALDQLTLFRSILQLSDEGDTTRRAEHIAGAASRRQNCHFDDTPCSSLLQHLIELQGGAIK